MRTFQKFGHLLAFSLLVFVFSHCRKPASEVLETASRNPSSIEKLDLGLGKLGTIPPTLFNFPNLKWLDLRMNELTSLPENSGDWSNLEHLNIYGNDIEKLPASISKLSKLRFFFAGNNDFENIPSELTGTPIEAIYLDSNKIELKESDVDILMGFQKLEILDLARNRKIASFPKNLGFLATHPKLRLLILKETGLKPSQIESARKLLPKVKIEF
ncbi:leucine-rich repeat domain-containing protein [Leptospira sarikeiensis]|uniref:Leucine-rich repeat domain-containing protein n=1 Tax=Leptospira sarikeiensis TaxID=2484943 RepID=A0A4R9K7N0_9LEPT|nr:leucine-rich repeat domain-containing protein [Leptospira sarikeiensis]TGL61436.1 leucine-rich repeat domain-containing protein [Leptospira sarikeiensis]